MKLINDNLKKTGYVNTMLIIVAIVFGLRNFTTPSLISKINAAVGCVSLLFGLFYSLSGYKKDSAKYYKAFMCLYALSSLISLISLIILLTEVEINLLIILHPIIALVIFVCSCVLAFKKDFGKEKSINISFVILGCAFVKLIASVMVQGIVGLYTHLIYLIEAVIVFVLVSAKYEDKESRGAK